jgi:hypothetical protein
MVEATDTERGRKPLHVAALMTIAVVSAFALLIAAAGIAQTAAAKRDDHALTCQTLHGVSLCRVGFRPVAAAQNRSVRSYMIASDNAYSRNQR